MNQNTVYPTQVSRICIQVWLPLICHANGPCRVPPAAAGPPQGFLQQKKLRWNVLTCHYFYRRAASVRDPEAVLGRTQLDGLSNKHFIFESDKEKAKLVFFGGKCWRTICQGFLAVRKRHNLANFGPTLQILFLCNANSEAPSCKFSVVLVETFWLKYLRILTPTLREHWQYFSRAKKSLKRLCLSWEIKFSKKESIQKHVSGSLPTSFAGDPGPLAPKITQEQRQGQACSWYCQVSSSSSKSQGCVEPGLLIHCIAGHQDTECCTSPLNPACSSEELW